jgi:hypothetical protein
VLLLVTWLTPPESPETLTRLFERWRPPGFWGQFRAQAGLKGAEAVPAKRLAANSLLGVLACLGLVLATNAINWVVGITTNAPTVAGPANRVVNPGQTATFSVAVAGPGPYRFQWPKNNAAVSGASYADYTTPATAPSDNGSTFQVVVTGLYGSVTSSPPATLTVQGSLPTPSNLAFTLSGDRLSLSWSGGAGTLLASPSVALPMTLDPGGHQSADALHHHQIPGRAADVLPGQVEQRLNRGCPGGASESSPAFQRLSLPRSSGEIVGRN